MIREILFFILLSPGMFITLPPFEKGIFMSQETSTIAILLHAIIFGIALYYTSSTSEGFQEGSSNAGTVNSITTRISARPSV